MFLALLIYTWTPSTRKAKPQCRAQLGYLANVHLPILKVLSPSKCFIYYCAGTMVFWSSEASTTSHSCFLSLRWFPHAGPPFWAGKDLSVRSCSSFTWPPHLPDRCSSNWVVIRTGIYLISDHFQILLTVLVLYKNKRCVQAPNVLYARVAWPIIMSVNLVLKYLRHL